MNTYAFNFAGHGVFTPDGKTDIQPTDTDAHNRAVEQAEIEWIKTAPDKLFLYVRHPKAAGQIASCESGDHAWQITTWLGNTLAAAWVGARAYTGFAVGNRTYRRPVTVRLFGTLYHGWYMESSGTYCRLRKAKRQHGNAARYVANYTE